MANLIPGRKCGECTACCKTHRVDEFDAPSGIWCKQCNINIGCEIYKQRPEGCQKFECGWLCGAGQESDRPDRLGIVMDITGLKVNNREIIVLNLWEVEPGATNQDRIEQITRDNVEAGQAVRQRLSVPFSISPSRIMDKIFYPAWMKNEAERQCFTETLDNTAGAGSASPNNQQDT